MSETPRMSPALTGTDGILISVGEVFTYPVHSHSYYELIFYLPFSGEVTVNGSALVPNEPFAVLMTPVDLHAVSCTGNASRFVKIAFTEDVLGGYLLHRLSGAMLLSIPEGASAVETLRNRITEHASREEKIILLRAIVLLLLEDGTEIPSPVRIPTHALISAAVTLIGNEFSGDITLKALSQKLNVSHQHLSACFKKYTGLSFSEYLCDIRLRHARSLLQSTTDTVTEICYTCGYRNLSHFLRSFKRKYGETPKEYRKSLPPCD